MCMGDIFATCVRPDRYIEVRNMATGLTRRSRSKAQVHQMKGANAMKDVKLSEVK